MIKYILQIETLLPKNDQLQSNPSFKPIITSLATLAPDNLFNAALSEWFLINEVPYVPGKNDNTFCNPLPKEDIGIYAPHMKPYPALTIVPIADTWPWDFKLKLITDDNAHPNNVSNITSPNRIKISPIE